MSFAHQSHTALRTQVHTGLLGSVVFAILTGIGALFIVIPLPFTPVPITGQTLFTILSGFVLGKKYGSLSQIWYISLGLMGIPWFSGHTSGFATLFGVTGGYLLGFVLASYVVGYLSDYSKENRTTLGIATTGLLGTLLIYIPGVLVLMRVLEVELATALQYGLYPFVPGDLLKLVLIMALMSYYLPNQTMPTDSHNSSKEILLQVMTIVSVLGALLFVLYLFSNNNLPPAYLLEASILTSVLILLTISLYSANKHPVSTGFREH